MTETGDPRQLREAPTVTPMNRCPSVEPGQLLESASDNDDRPSDETRPTDDDVNEDTKTPSDLENMPLEPSIPRSSSPRELSVSSNRAQDPVTGTTLQQTIRGGPGTSNQVDETQMMARMAGGTARYLDRNGVMSTGTLPNIDGRTVQYLSVFTSGRSTTIFSNLGVYSTEAQNAARLSGRHVRRPPVHQTTSDFSTASQYQPQGSTRPERSRPSSFARRGRSPYPNMTSSVNGHHVQARGDGGAKGLLIKSKSGATMSILQDARNVTFGTFKVNDMEIPADELEKGLELSGVSFGRSQL